MAFDLVEYQAMNNGIEYFSEIKKHVKNYWELSVNLE